MSAPRPLQISNAELTEDHLPPPNADWREIYVFALSFDGWESMANAVPPMRLATFANTVLHAFHHDGAIPPSLTMSEIRACLLYEDRRRRHLDSGYNEGNHISYVHALVESIRERLRAARPGGD